MIPDPIFADGPLSRVPDAGARAEGATPTSSARRSIGAPRPRAVAMEFVPSTRFDIFDAAARLSAELGSAVSSYQRVLYSSFHTTAGFLEQRLSARLEHCRERVDPFFRVFQRIFPPDAGYQHDELDRRMELSAEQRRVEPRNADSHLTFIGAGLRNCVTYERRSGEPVFFMELDGVYQGRARRRRATALAYNEEEVVAGATLDIPVSDHAIDSVSLAGPSTGLSAVVEDLLRRSRVEAGRLDIRLDPEERDAALTVNEFETLLMRHDLTEVLADPLRFMARQGRRMLADPRAVPAKSLGYARYDAVRILHELLDSLGLSQGVVERVISRLMAVPARRMLLLKRALSLPVAADEGEASRLVTGTYQSPILIQWSSTPRRSRTLRVELVKFH